ncbi:hypothetical protein R3I93_014946 [Phoxinus phoxinus]|uniref:Uncharacterized protein n=1 Tax=Phoxinus phoxinus TaxID=58324 RepID=A0AAN9H0L7_9TELE
MGDLFGDIYTRGYERPNDVESDLLQEMMTYEKEPPLPADSDPLLWWKIEKKQAGEITPGETTDILL